MLVAVAVLRGDAMPANPNLDPEENQGGSLAVGSVIDGTYTILSFVGQGGMGFVYKVEHLMMTKVMALKILRSEQISESVWKRFRTEAQAIARLDHPNVVRIYDMSQTKDGMPFYTMDFLVGKSLAEYLDQNDLLPVADSLPIFRQVCSGLAYAHDRGIVHRDIKPGNIMLIEEAKANLPPLVKIVDFGIAKLSSLDGAAVQGLTRPGEIVGSPLYMSPEQCSGKNLDFRTDMYSVGVTMFQALTGRAPLIGRSAIETISMHQTTVPILMSEAAPDLDFPQQLEEIVARLLAKSPEQRYDSLADVARELLDLERGSSNGLSEGASNLPSKNFVRQIDDSYAGGSTISDTNSMMLKRVKNLCVIFAAVVAPLCLVTAVVLSVLQPRRGAADRTAKYKRSLATSIAPQGDQAQSRLLNDTIENDALSQEQKFKIEAFLKSRKKTFAHLEIIRGKVMTVFEFPAQFSIGRFVAKAPQAKATVGGRATGRVEVALGSQFKFQANKSVNAYPNLLGYFGPEDVHWLLIDEGQTRTSLLVENLRRLTGLRSLDLRSYQLIDKDLLWIDKMDKLGALGLPSSTLSGQALARSPILSKLHRLQIHNVSDITPVLKSISATTPLAELDISYCGVDSADLNDIVKMRMLRRLSLRGAKLADADVAKLAKLPQIRDLDLRECKLITSDVYQVLKNFKNLKQLNLPSEIQNDEQDEALSKVLPALRKVD